MHTYISFLTTVRDSSPCKICCDRVQAAKRCLAFTMASMQYTPKRDFRPWALLWPEQYFDTVQVKGFLKIWHGSPDQFFSITGVS